MLALTGDDGVIAAERCRAWWRGAESGSSRQIRHAVQREERNIVWELAGDLWRPAKHPRLRRTQAAARRKGRNLPDPRSGEPAHRSDVPRLSKLQQADLADELGYSPTGAVSKRGQGEPIFHNPDGDPPYITYDRDGHLAGGAVTKPATQRCTSHKTLKMALNVPWKGATAEEADRR